MHQVKSSYKPHLSTTMLQQSPYCFFPALFSTFPSVYLHLPPSIFYCIFPLSLSPAIVPLFSPVFFAVTPQLPLLLYLLLYLFLLKSQSSSFASRPGRAGLLFLGFY